MRFNHNLIRNLSIIMILLLSHVFNLGLRCSIVKLDAEIGWFEGAPDGVSKQILGVDGDFAPIIRVNSGDRVEYKITNSLENDYVDIHFHGLFQRGTVTSDGASGMTQCAPMEGQEYLYKFDTAKQVGTFWYHSHFPLQQIDGLKGAFIIEDSDDKNPYLKPFDYYISEKYLKNPCDKFSDSLFYVDHSKCDGEADSVILLTDWYHKLAKDVLKDVEDGKPGARLTPDSALINGRGDYLCKSPPCKPMYDTKIILGKSKRIRVINTASMSPMHFAIQSHTLHVIECDGVYLDGKAEVEILRLNIGQRCSVIVKANKEPGNYWIRASMDGTKLLGRPSPNWKPDVYGVLAYADSKCRRFTSNDPSNEDYHSLDKLFEKSIAEGAINIDNNVNFRPHRKFYNPPPKKSNRTFEIKMSIIRQGRQILHTFNDIVFEHSMKTTELGLLLHHKDYTTPRVDSNGIKRGYNPLKFKKGEVVDFIFKNFDNGQHPLHMHGHVCYVMYQGKSNSDPNNFKFDYNPNVPLRDVASVNGRSAIVFRCIADNPGIWPFHCHISIHHLDGLMLTLIEDEDLIRKEYSRYKSPLIHCPHYDDDEMMSSHGMVH